MANKYYFFSDSDLVSQSNGQEYGPVSTSQFRLNSMHSGSNAKAYAICDGLILVQDIPGASTVNLILKPLVQPEQGINHLNYIVYKGIQKSSLFNGSNIAVATSNDLTQHIWDTQQMINDSIDQAEGNPQGTTQTVPPDSALGINFSASGAGTNLVADTDFLDKFFFTDGQYAPIKVSGGWSLGTFDASFGLEIIVQKLGQKTTFGDVRVFDNVLDVDTTGTSAADQFIAKNKKEKILTYLDPAAFYGSFFNYALQVKDSSATDFTEMDGSQFYSAFLNSFVNKSKIYLDIQNDYGYSFNYFSDYTNDIKVNGSVVNYYESGWPIYVANIPGGTTQFDIDLPVGENSGPLGYTPDSNFAAQGSHRFNWMRPSTAGYYALGIPQPVSQAGGSTVAGYLKVQYIKLINEDSETNQSNGTVLREVMPFDHVFNPMEMTYLFSGTGKSQGYLWYDPRYMDMFIVNEQSYNAITGVSKTETGNYIFFSYAFQKLVTNSSDHIDGVSFASGKTEQGENYLQELAMKAGMLFNLVDIGINGSTVSVPMLNTGNSENPILQKSSDDFFAFSLSADEYSTLEGIQTSQFQSDFMSFLSFKFLSGGVTNMGQNFLEVELVLNGFQVNGNDMVVTPVDTGITKYLIF